jgi:type II secretory pathway component GspD/PulD (secretin)/cell division protein FtsL
MKIMTMTKLKLGISALVVAGAAATLVIQHQAQTKLREENQSLRQQMDQLQTDNENLSSRLTAAGDSKSLSGEQLNELLKLRGEVTRLRYQQQVLPETAQLETNNLPHAKKTSIRVGTRFILLPPEDLQALGVEWMSGAQDGRAGLLTEQQFKIINEALQGASDVKVISAPIVISLNGEKAQISVSKSVLAGGTNANVGISLSVLPYFSTNSSTFDLTLSAELKQLAGDLSQPDVQTIQITNQMSLLPGQTAILEKEIPGGGWLSDATNIPAGPRVLLMFVTPTIVDSRDYQRNGQRVAAIWKSPTNMDSSDFPKSLQQQSPPNQ